LGGIFWDRTIFAGKFFGRQEISAPGKQKFVFWVRFSTDRASGGWLFGFPRHTRIKKQKGAGGPFWAKDFHGSKPKKMRYSFSAMLFFPVFSGGFGPGTLRGFVKGFGAGGRV